jgi:hypothetical protein
VRSRPMSIDSGRMWRSRVRSAPGERRPGRGSGARLMGRAGRRARRACDERGPLRRWPAAVGRRARPSKPFPVLKTFCFAGALVAVGVTLLSPLRLGTEGFGALFLRGPLRVPETGQVAAPA